MNKIIRIALIVVAVVAIIAIAGGSGVWASQVAKAPQAVALSGNAAPAAIQNAGTAAGWNCGGVNVPSTDEKGVCSVATVTSGNGSSVWAVASGNQGTDFKNGVVSITFKSGNQATICFAADPITGKVYFEAPDSSTWTEIAFSIHNGQACANISLDGLYAFGK